ncbi:MAG: KamA family radical SAM protein [Proteobacteria bacterium]|nr:KamA family radical SAM protein [Pseudomonadota bacterium]
MSPCHWLRVIDTLPVPVYDHFVQTTTLPSHTDQFTPPEFMKFADVAESLTVAGARVFGVSVETYVNWRWHMGQQITKSESALRFVNLDESESRGFRELEAIFHAGVTPYYMSLMGHHDETQLCPIRLQALPRAEELMDLVGVPDPLLEKEHSPVREVVHVYPDRVAFCVAQLCPVYCRYCYRKRRDEETGLHFNRTIVDRGIAYIASNSAITDVLITGGDPFIASDGAIESLVSRVRAIPHVEIIRFGTRTPVTLPYRVTDQLGKMLAKYHPIFVNTHFNCAKELTPEAAQAVANLVNNGIPVGNQSVFLKGVNDTYESMHGLLKGLLRMRVRPYYLFHPHNVEGTAHLRPTVDEGLAIMRKLRGNITGMGIPSYIIDTPSGKVPIGHNHVLGREGECLILEDVRGEIWRERGVIKKQENVPPLN